MYCKQLTVCNDLGHDVTHVLIAGGGLSGLCLAQGLTAAGVSCAVYERDPDLRRRTGYRITINGDGGKALAELSGARSLRAVPAVLAQHAAPRDVGRDRRPVPAS